MTLFVLIGAVIAALALAWTLRPLLRRHADARTLSTAEVNTAVYRDQLRELDADLAAGKLSREDHERSRRELEARALEEITPSNDSSSAPKRLWIAGVAVPIVAALVYFAVGNPAALDAERRQEVSAQQVEAMVARLAARLRENPDDADGWKLLGRSYMVLGRFPEAVDAYAKAASRAPRDAQLLADFADALGMARGQSMAGEPEKLVRRALEIDPNNLKALALAGTAAFERKDYELAARTWGRMLPLVPPDSEDARAIKGNIDEALALRGGKALRGEVRLDEKLKDRVSPDDTVFVFARAAEGPRLPLAVLRKRVRDLPASFTLDDSMAMAPGATLSRFPRVVIGARISRSGSANPQRGDLQGASAPVANDANGVRVVIDSVVR